MRGTHTLKLSRRFPAPIDTITRSSDLEDVALLRLSAVPREMSHIEFHDVAAYAIPRKIEGGVLVIGFPTELGYPVRAGGTVGTAGFLHIEPTNVSNRTLSTDKYDPALHFLVDFACACAGTTSRTSRSSPPRTGNGCTAARSTRSWNAFRKRPGCKGTSTRTRSGTSRGRRGRSTTSGSTRSAGSRGTAACQPH